MIINFLNTYIFGPALPVAVFSVGLILSAKLKFFPLLKPKKTFAPLFRSSGTGNSPVKALSVALAGTLGVGNIAGVAGAISLGGPGAVFWMWLSALFASVLKFSEILLAVKYRRSIRENGKRRFTGGAFAYMSAHGHRRLGFVFALLCVITSITMGSIVQSNSMAVAFEKSFGLSPYVVGAITALLTLLIISGGFSSVASITVRAVPAFCIIYTAVSLYVILTNASRLPGVIEMILKDAFSFRSAGVGVVSYGFIRAMRFGVARGILSNEAGSGTSPTAHAGSDTSSPCEQGFFGIAEVFIDTILLCSLTAFVILLSGKYTGSDAMLISIDAFGVFIGRAAPYFISLSVGFFAFATIICWSVYGVEALRFLLDDYFTGAKRGILLFAYRLLYSLSVLLGAVIPASVMWELSDLSVAVMTLINCGYILYLSGEIKSDTDKYFSQT